MRVSLFTTPHKRFLVFENGDIINANTLEPIKSRIDNNGYKWVGGIKVHKLIAELFVPKPIHFTTKLVVNHKDGNKLNNSAENLEWCTYWYNNYHARQLGLNNVSKSNSTRWGNLEFRTNMIKKLSRQGKKLIGSKNPNFRYHIYINGNSISRRDLANYLNLSQSYTDSLISKAAKGISIQIFRNHHIIVKQSQSTNR